MVDIPFENKWFWPSDPIVVNCSPGDKPKPFSRASAVKYTVNPDSENIICNMFLTTTIFLSLEGYRLFA